MKDKNEKREQKIFLWAECIFSLKLFFCELIDENFAKKKSFCIETFNWNANRLKRILRKKNCENKLHVLFIELQINFICGNRRKLNDTNLRTFWYIHLSPKIMFKPRKNSSNWESFKFQKNLKFYCDVDLHYILVKIEEISNFKVFAM